MENTPMTPYQRNRRAGRMSAPPPAAEMQAAPEPLTIPAPEAPSAPPLTAAVPRQQLVHTAAPAGQQVQRAASSPKAINAGPGWSMPAPRPQQSNQGYGSAKRPVTPVGREQSYRQSSLYGTGQYPTAARTPAQRKPVQQSAHRPGSAAQQQPQRRQAETHEEVAKVPAWLSTVLALLLIGVMALVTWSIWMHKELRENADAREKAYQNILYEYHLTETSDGHLRVTYQDLIEKYAAEYNLQPAFVTAIIRNESSFNTRAESHVGARGLMQLMPDTAQWIGGKLRDNFDYERLWTAEDNIRYGCWYLNYLSELFRGDPVMIAAAYHAGQGEVWSWLGDPAISPDGVTVPIENIPISNTRTYAGRVTKAYGIYQALLYPPDAVPAAGSSAVDGSLSDQR